jgi:hypothetical protein
MLEDGFLLIALMALLALHPSGPLMVALAAAIPIAIAWSRITLHRPTRVDIDDEGVAFSAYGREHRFAWSDVERVKVRRFVIRDRVLVRIVPAEPLRGRYWLRDSLDGYPSILAKLEERARLMDRTGGPAGEIRAQLGRGRGPRRSNRA